MGKKRRDVSVNGYGYMKENCGFPGGRLFRKVEDILFIQALFTQGGKITKNLSILRIQLHVILQRQSWENEKRMSTESNYSRYVIGISINVYPLYGVDVKSIMWLTRE